MREHMESENDHDFDTTLRTFGHPRYELIATGETYDGDAEVSAYYAETRAAFPDQRNELIALHHAKDSTIAEFWLLGTHLGPLRGLPPTRPLVSLSHDVAVPLRGRAAGVRARLLRPGDDPAPARPGARSRARSPVAWRSCSTTR